MALSPLQFKKQMGLTMFKPSTKRFTLSVATLIGILGLTACSTHGSSSANSRYGWETYQESGYAWQQGGEQAGVCCGYWVVPVHHIVTTEKQIEVEKEVIKEVIKELPPQIVYKNNPCPPDTTADSNGACIRVVEREKPCYGQPCIPQPPVIICQRENGLPCKK